ncbi:multidrug transporter [Palleronia sediminis]|uniref:Guanidinium exporter n=1 Tax=Palleronia sediminis TaxID=2547833 RepID=A0A4R6A7Z2_9RHOB|nr:EamA family transporter [Palleronia sediminis]TDL79830.1 multidrug transporter [Palleronia sediminis]
MMAWVEAVEGTARGHDIALVLALSAAFLHAIFGALQKGRHDPWISRMAMDWSYGLMAAPFALFVVPWPAAGMWPIFAVVVVVHIGYKLVQAACYSRGAFTVVYPVLRGVAPLFTVIGAYVLFGERFTALQWLGVGVLLAGIFGLALYNLVFLTTARDTLPLALVLAVITGLFVALYTTIDAYGIRATPDPATFLAWFFFLDGIFFATGVALVRRAEIAGMAGKGALAARGVLGGAVAIASFGAIMLATRLDKVGEAAVLRETSTVFAALIGWVMLGERVGPRRLALMAAIASGAVIVEFGG